MSDEKTMGQVIQIDEARIRDHLGEDGAGGGRRDAKRHAGRRGGPAMRSSAL
jgi:hypothetical protein